jgi:lauroyl/myristoyl acyltransferase
MSGNIGWKTIFYGAPLPVLRRLGPARADAVLSMLGRAAHALWWPRRQVLRRAAARAGAAFPDAGPHFARALAGNATRVLARDFLLDAPDWAILDSQCDICNFEFVADSLAAGRGLVLVGCHLGAYVPALHWLYRRGLPLRVLIQRPSHVSAFLRRHLDATDPPCPQAELFLKRSMPTPEAAARLLAARAALRAGMVLYACGDIPWPTGRPGTLLGRPGRFLALWAELAASTGAPVVPVFGTFQRGGRYRVAFDPPRAVAPGREADALADYLARLERAVADDPAQAVPYWTWPGYDRTAGAPAARPARRILGALGET